VRGRKVGSKRIGGLEVKVYVDLSADLGPSKFDEVVRALSETIQRSASLSLDDAKDRETLNDRLLHALGGIVA
jgi:hypothetical protein